MAGVGARWHPAACQGAAGSQLLAGRHTAWLRTHRGSKPSLRSGWFSSILPSLPEDSGLLGPASNVPDCGGAWQIPV